jgi:hypothetical protein
MEFLRKNELLKLRNIAEKAMIDWDGILVGGDFFQNKKKKRETVDEGFGPCSLKIKSYWTL